LIGRLKPHELHERKQGTLLRGFAGEIPGHVSTRYPFPARLNKHYVEQLKALKVAKLYSTGAILFREGEKSAGVYVVLEGGVKLSVNSAQGKTLVLGFFRPGTILGLAAAILGHVHATTAEALKPTEVICVSRKEFIKEIQGDATAARQAAELVSEACYFLLTKMISVELSQTASQKLARCLVGLLAHNAGSCEGTPPELCLSQETIAQMVGLSRETVARILSRFRRSGILDWKRSGFLVRNRRALEKLADFSKTTGYVTGIPITGGSTRTSHSLDSTR